MTPNTPSASADPQYRVRTYDVNLGEYTKQDGVPEIVTGTRGLIGAIRLLRSLGYPCDRTADGSDPSVLIERVENPKQEKDRRFTLLALTGAVDAWLIRDAETDEKTMGVGFDGHDIELTRTQICDLMAFCACALDYIDGDKDQKISDAVSNATADPRFRDDE